VLAERQVQDRLEARIEWYKADSRRFERMLLENGVGADEASRARSQFDDEPPAVIQGYARQGGVFPCVAIVLGVDENADDYLGEDAPFLGESDDPDAEDGLDYYRDEETGAILDPHMRRWNTRLDLYLYADHPDVTRYLYKLVKHILVSSRAHWHSLNFEEVTYSGAELAPDPRYLPADMFTRRFSMTFRYHDYYTDEGVVEKPSEAVAAVDDGEMLSDALTAAEKAEMEDYPYGVTPYQEDDDA
jgi:hypothetical protein